MQISQGQRIPLSNLIQGRTLSVAIQIKSSPTVDLACFALDAFGGYTDLMVDGAPLPHQPDTIIRWLIDRLRS